MVYRNPSDGSQETKLLALPLLLLLLMEDGIVVVMMELVLLQLVLVLVFLEGTEKIVVIVTASVLV